MNIFNEDKTIFNSGGLKSAFVGSLIIFLLISASEFMSILLINNLLLGLFLNIIVLIILILIYFFTLKKGITKYNLFSYSLRVEYLAIMTILALIYSFLLILLITGELQFPNFGLLPWVAMFLMPYFIKN